MLEFRLAAATDSADLLAWRNDPYVKSMMLTTAVVDPDTHAAWLGASLVNSNRIMVIAQIKDASGKPQAVAIVRFDRIRDGMYVSVNMNPLMRGRGFAASALLGAERYLPRGEDITLIAEIKIANEASRRAFERAGYQIAKKAGDANAATMNYRKSYFALVK